MSPHIEEGLAKAGRKRGDFTLQTGTFMASGVTSDEVRKTASAVRQQGAFYASARTYKGVLDAHGWGETCFRLNEKAAKGDWDSMAAEITDELLDGIAVIGIYNTIAAILANRHAGLLDRLIAGFHTSARQDPGRYREFVQEVRSQRRT